MDYKYTLKNGEITIDKYVGHSKVVFVPESIDGYPVTVIGKSAFYGGVARYLRINTIVIPESVKVIEDYAFTRCRDLEIVLLPNSLTQIGLYAFGECSKLESVNLNEKITTIPYGAFYGCKKLSNVSGTEGVEYVNESAFHDCISLTNINLDVDKVKYIGDQAFFRTAITSFTLPKQVRYVQPFAFYECTKLERITLHENLHSIGEQSFIGCKSLTSIDLPSSLTYVGENAFCNCRNLKKVNVWSLNAEWVNDRAFTYRVDLNTFELLEGVTVRCREGSTAIQFAANANYECELLSEAEYQAYLKEAIAKDLKPTDYYFIENENSVTITKYIGSDTVVSIPKNLNGKKVTCIGEKAFRSYHYVKRVILNENVKAIGDSAFWGCHNLVAVENATNLEVLGYMSFAWCKKLNDFTLPETLVRIGASAFMFTSFKTVEIPSKIVKLDDCTFGHCKELREVTLPKTLTDVHPNCFMEPKYEIKFIRK